LRRCKRTSENVELLPPAPHTQKNPYTNIQRLEKYGERKKNGINPDDIPAVLLLAVCHPDLQGRRN
jgi:hypothetical protein